jgi:putative ABC transport system substrate-binding protein
MWRDLDSSKAFLSGLDDLGYIEGKDFAIEFGWAEGELNRLPAIAADLVARKVDVLYPNVCGATLNAAMQATRTIPIVVAACNDDMVELGTIKSLAHPGGNVTGLNKMTPELSAKRLDLLKELVPEAVKVGVMWDPRYSSYTADWRLLRARTYSKPVTLQPVEVRSPSDIDRAFAMMAQDRTDALLSLSDTLTYGLSQHIGELAAAGKLPTVTPFREITQAGGLMSYGPNIPDMFRRSAWYVAEVLKGVDAGEIPVEQPSKFEVMINIKAAKSLGIAVPLPLLTRADEVIE